MASMVVTFLVFFIQHVFKWSVELCWDGLSGDLLCGGRLTHNHIWWQNVQLSRRLYLRSYQGLWFLKVLPHLSAATNQCRVWMTFLHFTKLIYCLYFCISYTSQIDSLWFIYCIHNCSWVEVLYSGIIYSEN